MGYSKIYNAKVKELGKDVRVEANNRVYLFTADQWDKARIRAQGKGLYPLIDTFVERFVG